MVTKLGPYEVHPFAADFPLIDGQEFDELVASVKANGLRQPIVLSHDRAVLIDGRNRYRACEAAGIEPTYETLPPGMGELAVLDLIVDRNVRHRHLDAGQRAFAALSYEKRYAEAVADQERQRKQAKIGAGKLSLPDPEEATMADPPQSPAPTSRHRAAKATGASGRGVQMAKALERDAPDLAAKVRAGEMSLDAAERERKKRNRNKPKPEKPARPSRATLTLLAYDGTPVAYPEPEGKPKFNETTGDGISWGGWSWNPVTGCLHECPYCYARDIANNPQYAAGFPVGFTPLFHHERLDAPANTTIPARHRDDPAYRRVFVCSMADLYGKWVPDDWINKVHESMLASPQWEYLLLTKFPSRYTKVDLPPSAWVGTSVDEQRRVPIAESAFRKIEGVKVKWLSLEPLRGPLRFTDLSMFDWIVIGAQTATNQPGGHVPAVQPEYDWWHDIYHLARESGCKVHLKPNLITGPGSAWPNEFPGSE